MRAVCGVQAPAPPPPLWVGSPSATLRISPPTRPNCRFVCIIARLLLIALSYHLSPNHVSRQQPLRNNSRTTWTLSGFVEMLFL